jgi:putative Mg2+ transporter-C (MgtC) family protein
VNWFEAFDPAFWARVGLAILCGGAIGLERQLRRKAAGVRTSILVCLGTMTYAWLGAQLVGQADRAAGADPSRVLSQIVTGVGFLGAGVILMRGDRVEGVTTAAVVWVLAAIGAAIGLGRGGIAIALSATTIICLVGLQLIEDGIAQWRKRDKGLRR